MTRCTCTILFHVDQKTTILDSCDNLEELTRLLGLSDANASEAWANGWTCLHAAAVKGTLDIIQLLLANNANPNAQQIHTLKTPLHEAAFRGWNLVATELLNAGARNDITMNNGQTPSELARSKGHISTADLIIENGGYY